MNAFNAGDLAQMQALCTDDVVVAGLRAAVEDTSYTGSDAVHEFWRDAPEVWEEMRMEIEEITAQGDAVTVGGTWHGRGRGSGIGVDRAIIVQLRLRQGRIASFRTLVDPREAA